MSDYISRKAAYDTITAQYHHRTETQHKMLMECLEGVPSVDAQPVKHGRWECSDGGVYCSVCHLGWEFIRGVPRGAENYRYCPICGARMDGKEDED